MAAVNVADLTVKQMVFLTAYAKTDNLSRACRVAEINRTTGYRYLELEEFQLVLQQMKTKIVNAAWEKLSGNLEIAVAKVIQILNDPRTTVNAKLRATELVLNYSSLYPDYWDGEMTW